MEAKELKENLQNYISEIESLPKLNLYHRGILVNLNAALMKVKALIAENEILARQTFKEATTDEVVEKIANKKIKPPKI